MAEHATYGHIIPTQSQQHSKRHSILYISIITLCIIYCIILLYIPMILYFKIVLLRHHTIYRRSEQYYQVQFEFSETLTPCEPTTESQGLFQHGKSVADSLIQGIHALVFMLIYSIIVPFKLLNRQQLSLDTVC